MTAACPRSLVVPVYRNEENIDDLIAALNRLNQDVGGMEVVFVVDGSPDGSGEALLAGRRLMHFSAQIIFHSRNFGSFTAIRTGIEFSHGVLIGVMAADLQEPPELIQRLFGILEEGQADIAFGQRTGRHDSILRDLLSNGFWWLYRKMVIPTIPKGGVDIFACNRKVANSVMEFAEPNSSLIAQLFWVGFRRCFVPYERRARVKGKSSWGFARRMRYMMDSIFSFSDLPVLLILWLGLFGCIASAIFGVYLVFARLTNFITVPGYTALAVLITFATSGILLVQGIIGAYLWRTFENTKRRPLRVIDYRVEHHYALILASEEKEHQ